jgi:hypothetical protein
MSINLFDRSLRDFSKIFHFHRPHQSRAPDVGAANCRK